MSLRSARHLILAATACATPAVAAANPLEVVSRVLVEQRTTAADGTVRTALVPATRAVPGDRIVFVLSYRNTGKQPLADLVFDNPLPPSIAYRAPMGPSAAPELSVDGKTFGALANLRVASADGSKHAASAGDVTHVRWRLMKPLAAGAGGELAFHASLK